MGRYRHRLLVLLLVVGFGATDCGGDDLVAGTTFGGPDGPPVDLFDPTPDSTSWAGYSRVVDGLELDLEFRLGEIWDPVSGDRWDATLGSPRSGQGHALNRIPLFSSFASDFEVFFPDGELIALRE